MAEAAIQKRIIDYFNRLPQGIAENVSGNASQSGRADINACYKGICIKIEVKDPKTGYQPTDQQLLYLEKWKKAGAHVCVAYSLDDVKKIIADIDRR